MDAHFELEEEEQRIVADFAFFHAKHRITEKLYHLFGKLAEEYQEKAKPALNRISPDILSIPPKIYRGENYLRLPYVMLDYPRYFKQDETLAIRSLFWWGKYFSIHLVLGGKLLLQFEEVVKKGISEVLDPSWHYSITNDPWHHHFEPENYVPIEKFVATQGSYLKLAKKLPLEEWNNAGLFFAEAFGELVTLLQG